MVAKEENVKERRLIDLTALRVYSMIVAYFDPYYDTIIVVDRIAGALADNQKIEKIRSCLDNYYREEDQLCCIFKEAWVEDMWLKYKNIIGSRFGKARSAL
jgi:regulator of sigma D